MVFKGKGKIILKDWQMASVNTDLEAKRSWGGCLKPGV